MGEQPVVAAGARMNLAGLTSSFLSERLDHSCLLSVYQLTIASWSVREGASLGTALVLMLMLSMLSRMPS